MVDVLLKEQGMLNRATVGSGRNGALAGLLAEILDRFGDLPALATLTTEGEKTQEVVCVLTVGGAHYTLLRTRPLEVRLEVRLSPREQEIARLVADGCPNKAIAAVLEISPWTVATHLRRIFTKIGVNSRAEMVARMMKDGLLSKSH